MAEMVITIILLFNIILVILYFIMRIHKYSIDKARKDYTQATAEAEVFGITGAVDAEKKRKQLAQLETAQFSGQTGVGALARERAGQF